VLEGDTLTYPERGTPQGGVRSPMLANIFGRLFGRKGTVAWTLS